MRRVLVLTMTALGAVLPLSGCGDSSSGTPDGPRVVDITIPDRSAPPSSVVVRRGQGVELDIHARTSGTIRVETTPRQTIEYHPGTTQASLGPFAAGRRVAIESVRPVETLVTLRVR